MVSPFAVFLPTRGASFESVIRSSDESPQNAFSVELTGHLVLYGIWRPKWAPNEHDFHVQIVSFGWADKNNVGNPNPLTRRKLSVEQAADVKALITALVENVDVTKKITPFSSKTVRFLGSIGFQDNWIFAGGLIQIEGQLPLSRARGVILSSIALTCIGNHLVLKMLGADSQYVFRIGSVVGIDFIQATAIAVV